VSTTLPELLHQRITNTRPEALCVGFSGGPDSTALLHALAQLPEARALGLRALHIDHGLQAPSSAWAQHCADFCTAIGVPLTSVRVQVDTTRGEGLEAAARRVRYAAFAEQLHAGEWLVLAHHRDDQIETVLLKLLRGAGPEGLAGMRERRPFAQGWLWRPLLQTPRGALQRHLADHGLASIDDPANADARFARNRVRHAILPALRAAFAHADAAIVHTARQCRAAADYLAATAATALTPLWHADGTLDAAGWLALPDGIRAPVLDAWLRTHGLAAPPDAARAELQRQAATAGADASPRINWANAEVRVWSGRLHAMPRLAPPPADWRATWNGAPLDLPPGCGVLELVATGGPTRPPRVTTTAALTVRLRRGGERIRPAGDAHTRDLRDLFQRAGVPPWIRARCPLIHADDQLIAVADLWASAQGQRLFDALDMHPRWTRPTWARSSSTS
jgi:tRNA(Ile)-lysidine synthase